MSTAMATFTDESVAYNPAEYVDAGATILPRPGTYRVRCQSFGRRKDRLTGQEVTRDGWPILVLNRIEILEPYDEVGTFAVFEEVSTKPYARTGPGGSERKAARHMDLLRSLDQDIQVESFQDGVSEVETLLASGAPFVAQIGYKAQDSEWAKSTIQQGGGKDGMSKEAYNKVWNDAKLSTKDFKMDGGGYRTVAMGRSGKMLDAKLTISKFIPSRQAETTELGVYGAR